MLRFASVLGLALSMLVANAALAGGSAGNGDGNGKDRAAPAAPAKTREKAADPTLPAGRDPGGIAVSWVGDGLDYTADHIRNRLTRDGEGELTGFDFADNDRRPFAPTPSAEFDAAGIFLGESQTGTLVVLRTARNDPKSLFTAIGYGLRTPARLTVILNDTHAPETAAALREAALHFPAHLFVTGPFAIKDGAGATVPPNLIRVAAVGAMPRHAPADADIAVPVDVPPQPENSATIAAQSRIAALAVRLLAVEPNLDAAAVKARMIVLAKSTDAPHGAADVPEISDPRRHFWLE